MHQIKPTEYGMYVQVIGAPKPNESKIILSKIKNIIDNLNPGFCVFTDLRKMELLSEEAQLICLEIQTMIIKAGVNRIAVTLEESTPAYQFKRLSLQSGIFDYDRYFDASTDPDWKQNGLNWVIKGIDPEAKLRERINNNNNYFY